MWIFHAKSLKKNPICCDQYWDNIVYTQPHNDTIHILHFQNFMVIAIATSNACLKEPNIFLYKSTESFVKL